MHNNFNIIIMEIKKLIAIAAISVSTISLYAQDGLMQTMIKNYPQKKEYITYNKNNGRYIYKTIYQYKQNGKLTGRIAYQWDEYQGWVATVIHRYEYNDDNKVTNIYFTKWDFSKEQWSDKSKNIILLYNTEGKPVSTKQIQIDTKKDMLLSAY